MKILIVSDSHRNLFDLRRVIKANRNAEVVFCLGDGEYDYMQCKLEFPDMAFITVRGNCDYGSTLPETQLLTLNNKRILAQHGHMENVKFGLDRLMYKAEQANADIVLFGHTHIPFNSYICGRYFVNPGSVGKYNGTYATIDIRENGVLVNIAYVKELDNL